LLFPFKGINKKSLKTRNLPNRPKRTTLMSTPWQGFNKDFSYEKHREKNIWQKKKGNIGEFTKTS
jgi:hypothetical protein